jgi:nucleotide-binding universal stress UspA family protein
MLSVQSILVPVDFSDHSKHALEYAIALARKLGASVHALHSYWAPPPTSYSTEVVVVPQSFWEELGTAAAKKLETLLQEVDTEGIEIDFETTLEDPVTAIVECAEHREVDLIVMGTRGLTGLKHLLLGSTAERTIRMAPCPVLTVKATME